MVKLKKRILILIAAHVVGLTGFRYWQANDYEFSPPTPEERAAELGQAHWGLIRVPVANLNADNRFSASVVTQALMGMPIRLLQKNGWYEVQLPDGYTGWLHASQFVRMTEEALGQWNAREHLIVTSLNAPVTSVNDETIVTTLVAGARVAKIRESESVYVVELPDGRQGEIAKESVAEMAVFQEVERVRRGQVDFGTAVQATAELLLGQSYQWGGTSVQAMDCSGFIKTVYALHDMILPRDAGQQAYIGERFYRLEEAQAGDLHFFGSVGKDYRARVSHVGLSVGEGRFIHALGDVHRASLMPKDKEFDAYEKRRYLWSVRIRPQSDDPCWQSSRENGFNQTPPQPLKVCRLKKS